jgi:hypothetical protein
MAVLAQILIALSASVFRWTFLRGHHLRFRRKNTRPDRMVYWAPMPLGTRHHIGIARTAGPDFHAYRERWYHRALRSLRIPGLGDGKATYYVATDAIIQAQTLNPLLDRLFDLPVKSVHAVEARLWASVKSGADEDEIVALLKEIEPHLQVPNRSRTPRAKMAHAAIALNLGFFWLGVVGFLTTVLDEYLTVDWWGLILAGMIAAPFIVTAWLFLLNASFWQTSWNRRVVGDFLLSGAIGLAIFTPTLVRDFNVMLPQGEPNLARHAVIDIACRLTCDSSHPVWRYFSRHSQSRAGNIYSGSICRKEHWPGFIAWEKKKRSSCAGDDDPDLTLLVILDYPGRSEPLRFTPSSDVFEAASRKNPMLVWENPGALGFAWIDSAEIVPYTGPYRP